MLATVLPLALGVHKLLEEVFMYKIGGTTIIETGLNYQIKVLVHLVPHQISIHQ